MKLVEKSDHRVTSKPWQKRQRQYSRRKVAISFNEKLV